MNTMRYKIRFIFLPFLWIAAGFMLVYSFLDWWLVMRPCSLWISEELAYFGLPFVLPWIPVLIWLRPRIKLLKIKARNVLPYAMVAAFAIGGMTILLQLYIDTATGQQTNLPKISQIGENKPTKYYAFQDYYVAKELAQTINRRYVTGKVNSQHLNFDIFIVVPLLDKEVFVAPPSSDGGKGTLIGEAPEVTPKAATEITQRQGRGDASPAHDPLGPQAWLCVRYTKQLSNDHDPSIKDVLWDEFFRASWEDFRKEGPGREDYLERTGNNQDRTYYEKAIKKSPLYTPSSGTLTILTLHPGPFAQRNGKRLTHFLAVCGFGALIWLLMLLPPALDEIG
ncbi:MAG TPA: hypothetical protein VNS58_25585 [Puia sp.]|nr:hypothetical protein [Puia sp.]